MARTILFALLFSAANAITEPTEPITEADVAAVQKEWGDSLISIGKHYTDGGDYERVLAGGEHRACASGVPPRVRKWAAAPLVPQLLRAAAGASQFLAHPKVEDTRLAPRGQFLTPPGARPAARARGAARDSRGP